jgi:hypothetical protein
MAVDSYTKLVLTVIAVCLVWLSVGGSSLITPVSAQNDRVYLAGWIDDSGRFMKFPAAPGVPDNSRPTFGGGPAPTKPRTTWSLPVDSN